ncbi:carbonic anhydrase [Janibacter limosus]|uniref:beta-class carbonic anhydrase n=1 Tax=Janibacter limosus TaxID=53458 RepID=UPI0035DFFB97|nr:carbonic anhydrase [Janibacter limosus]
MPATRSAPEDFADLPAANQTFSESFALSGFDGIARAGVAIVTCMDSRIDPLGMLGLKPGDAKIFHNPGGRITTAALEALVLGVHLLEVERTRVIPHTRCAMGSATEDEFRAKVGASAGRDASWQGFHVVHDQLDALRRDIAAVRTHLLIADRAKVGGFVYDVDTGLLDQKF